MTEPVLIPAPSGSLPILVDGKSPPRDSHDNTFIGKEIEVRGLGFGASVSGATFF